MDQVQAVTFDMNGVMVVDIAIKSYGTHKFIETFLGIIL